MMLVSVIIHQLALDEITKTTLKIQNLQIVSYIFFT